MSVSQRQDDRAEGHYATNVPVPVKLCKDTEGEEGEGFKQGPALGCIILGT